MAFATPEYWEAHYQEANGEHIDWLCQYSTLRKVVLHYLRQWKRPLPAILLLGTGLSTFAEELYDGGYSPIMVLDFAPTAVQEHQKRTAKPPRGGLTVVQCDVADPEWPEVDEAGMRYGIVVDKGLIDCLLTSPSGIDRASAAITNVWSHMTTPAVWISVSHSPPADRRDLYCLSGAAVAGTTSVYWHNIQVKRVRLPPLEYSSKTAVQGKETLEDYNDWEGAGLGSGPGGAPRGEVTPGEKARSATQVPYKPSEAGDGQGQSTGELPGADVFRDDVAYIYILTK
ncbi:hypothetical protein VOLCADRAFT_86168 [Volvox carteri f. nagariensis]|uniref:Methyltransferase domain-containing protein n=1 Tax=Volvox carteri f. nagariensis TaxID=3068 RepID=D8TI20_VOLCA|nr:uncharacterized protein VOLCADRAFT_86168 [Volvox carteri f. nagariensis]EFJ53164.1 hypothetical protein VOLCADRAFT_86168 [Volvox carteri f. nagariensis]|eukprot:XP_002946169.1 hypothetical protein VOLCADRAFT_86168 [Volvox carteri f. nagariensis]